VEGLFSKTKYFAGTIFLINGFSHHVSRVQIIKNGARDQNQNETYLQGPKTTKKNYKD